MTPWKNDPDYQAYLQAQFEKTTHMAPVQGARVVELVRFASLAVRRSWAETRVLCVGCRSRWELDIWRATGADVTGLDLVGQDPRVTVGDMHAMPFPDESFDVVFACHSLEHAYDIPRVLSEWQRVSVTGAIWVVEVPIGFPPTTVDRHDAGSVDGLLSWLSPCLVWDVHETATKARVVVEAV